MTAHRSLVRRVALGIAALILGGCSPSGGMTGNTDQGGASAHAGSSSLGGAAGNAGFSAGGAGAGGETGGDGGSAAFGSTGGEAPASNLGALHVESVAPWLGNATAAYTIIHDDACDYTLDSLFTVAEPELTARGLHAAFGAIVERCQERSVWSKLEVMVAHGHEIICHSWDHKDFVADAPNLSVEVDQATNVLAANIPDQKLEYFIFPFDSFSQPMIDHLGEIGYVGARAGKKGVNTPEFADPLRESFDVYNDENSIYYPQFSDVLKAYVDDAIAKGGWAIREFHGIADMSWEPVPTADYEAHLDYVKSKVDEGALWVDTPSVVTRYSLSRKNCGLPITLGGAVGFPSPSAECVAHATPLSVIITTDTDAATLSATQAGHAVPAKKLGPMRFLVDIDPSAGGVIINGA